MLFASRKLKNHVRLAGIIMGEENGNEAGIARKLAAKLKGIAKGELQYKPAIFLNNDK